MGRTAAITSAWINLGRVSSADVRLRVGTRPALTDLPPVARAAGAGGVIRLRLTRPARGRYVLVWFTRLPADPAGTFQTGVHDISLQGHGDKGLRVAMLRTLRSGSEEIYAWAGTMGGCRSATASLPGQRMMSAVPAAATPHRYLCGCCCLR
jgi:hypothetical protein